MEIKVNIMVNQIQNEIAFYETEDGKIKISVLLENENLWLT